MDVLCLFTDIVPFVSDRHLQSSVSFCLSRIVCP